MMKLLFFGLMASTISSATGQTLQAEVSYQYLYNQQWDRIIQTYNESRPFLDEKQPLFQHGMNVGTGYLFPSSGAWTHGIHAGYTFFLSRAENTEFTSTVLLHTPTLSYQLHRDQLLTKERFFVEGSIGVAGAGAYRRVNGESLLVDEERSKAWGVGGVIGLGAGYHFPIGNRMEIDPFVRLTCMPGFYFPGIEKVVNQTQGLVAKSFSTSFSLNAGIKVHFLSK